jgi:hypothetical protein
LKCIKTQRWREELLSRKWANMNEETPFRKLVTGDKITELRNLGTVAYEIECK